MAVDRSMQVEGIFTVACGLLGFFVVPSTPAATRLLSPDQKEWVIINPHDILKSTAQYIISELIIAQLARGHYV